MRHRSCRYYKQGKNAQKNSAAVAGGGAEPETTKPEHPQAGQADDEDKGTTRTNPPDRRRNGGTPGRQGRNRGSKQGDETQARAYRRTFIGEGGANTT